MHTVNSVLVAACAALATAALAQAQTVAPAATSAPTAAAVKSSAHSGKKTGAATKAPLDLHAPPLNHIYSSRQLRYIMAPDDTDADSLTAVSVKGTRTVQVPGAPGNQLLAIPWAIMHPTQAWRIFTPLEQQ